MSFKGTWLIVLLMIPGALLAQSTGTSSPPGEESQEKSALQKLAQQIRERKGKNPSTLEELFASSEGLPDNLILTGLEKPYWLIPDPNRGEWVFSLLSEDGVIEGGGKFTPEGIEIGLVKFNCDPFSALKSGQIFWQCDNLTVHMVNPEGPTPSGTPFPDQPVRKPKLQKLQKKKELLPEPEEVQEEKPPP